MNEIHDKESGFFMNYSNIKTMTYDKKTCNFLVEVVPKNVGELPIVNKVEDMAPYVGESGKAQRIDLDNTTVPGLYLDVEWTIIDKSNILNQYEAKGGYDPAEHTVCCDKNHKMLQINKASEEGIYSCDDCGQDILTFPMFHCDTCDYDICKECVEKKKN